MTEIIPTEKILGESNPYYPKTGFMAWLRKIIGDYAYEMLFVPLSELERQLDKARELRREINAS